MNFLKNMDGTAHQFVGICDLKKHDIKIFETLEKNIMLTPYNFVTMNPDKNDIKISDYIYASKEKIIRENPIKYLRKKKNGMFHIMIIQGKNIFLSTQSILQRAFVNTFLKLEIQDLFSTSFLNE